MLLEQTNIYNNLCDDLNQIGDKLAQLGYYKTQGSQLIKFDLETEQLIQVDKTEIIKIIEEIPEFKLYETQLGQTDYLSHILKCLTPISNDKIKSFHFVKKHLNVLEQEKTIKKGLKELLKLNKKNKKADISYMSEYSKKAVEYLRNDDIFVDTNAKLFYQFDGTTFKKIEIKRTLNKHNIQWALDNMSKIEKDLTPISYNFVNDLNLLLTIQENPEHLKNYNQVKEIIEADLNVTLDYT